MQSAVIFVANEAIMSQKGQKQRSLVGWLISPSSKASKDGDTDDAEESEAPPKKVAKSESSEKASVSAQSAVHEKKDSDRKKNYEEKRVRGYLPQWETEFPWLVHDENESKMYCRVCRRFPELHDRQSQLVAGTSTYRKRTLQTHSISTHHVRCMKEESRKDHPEQQGPMDVVLSNIDEKAQKRMERIFNTAFHVAKKKKPFSDFPDLLVLQEKNGLDIGDQYRNDKQCNDFVGHIAEVSIGPSIHLSSHLSVHPSIQLSIHLSGRSSSQPAIRLFVRPSVRPSVC